jgi:hypothetical protein
MVIIGFVMAFFGLGIVSAIPQPTVSLSVPGQAFIGETFTLRAVFDNVGADIGYGPFIDLVLPAAGADGNDGASFVSAAHLGVTITTTRLVFDGDGCITHPFLRDVDVQPVEVCGRPGDELIVIELPFGSYTPSQPPVEVDITASMSILADIGVPLRAYARGGFRFGADPLNNPCCDPPVVDPFGPASGSWPSAPITPVLLAPEKEYLGPGDDGGTPVPAETVTGPNGADGGSTPVRYRLRVDIADGQSLSSVNLTDLLPPGMQFDQLISVSPAGATPAPGPIPPNSNLVITWPAPITGTTANNDIEVVVQVFFGNITGANGTPTGVTNQITVNGTWQPPDPRDGLGAIGVNGAANAPIVLARSLAVQKSAAVVGGGNALPGRRLRYGLDFQVSDYFAFDQVVINDTLSDGLIFDAASVVLNVEGGGVTFNGAMAPGNITVTPNADGTTSISFNVSAQIGAPLVGGCIDPVAGTTAPDCQVFNSNALTRGTISFEVTIADVFSGPFPDPSIDHGDQLANGATINGRALNPANFLPAGFNVVDDALRETQIARGSAAKTLYAINGAICTPCGVIQVSAGDQLTYRLNYDLPSTDFEGLTLTEFLPSPVFNVSDPDANGAAGPAWTFDNTISAAAPPAGVIKFGPDETFFVLSGIAPVPAVNAAENTITFNYASFDNAANAASEIDLLLTVSVTTAPYADGLILANQLNVSEGSTNGGTVSLNAIAAIETANPVLILRKGVISVSNPGAVFDGQSGPVTFTPPGTPGPRWPGVINSDLLDQIDINSNVSGLNPGDRASFAIVIENIGSNPEGAFDIRIQDILPPGYLIPPEGLNLRVVRGDGTPISFNDIGAGLFDPAGGIELIDPDPTEGACQVYSPTSGGNIIIITYDLQLDPALPIPTGLTNTAQLTSFAASDGGSAFANFVSDSSAYRDTADAVIGFLTGGRLTAQQIQQIVTTLPATGEPPSYDWIPLMLALILTAAGAGWMHRRQRRA